MKNIKMLHHFVVNPKAQKALHRIVKLLRKHKLAFQISGGFAGEIYGSPRPLHDIDIDVEDEAIKILYSEVKEYIIYGPAHYKDSSFDQQLMTLRYHGQDIDIWWATSQKIFNPITKKWDKMIFDPDDVTRKNVAGLRLPVITKEKFLNYEKKLVKGSKRDRQHITDIKSALKNVDDLNALLKK